MQQNQNVPEIRFPEFDDEWKEKKFYECVEIEGKLVNTNFHEYQNLPHIGPGNIQKNTGRILNYNLVKDENLISGKFEFDEEDIIYGKINPQLQKICIPGFRGLASADTYPIKTISGVSNTYFIYYSLFTSRFFKYSVSVSMRTGMPKINKEELGSYNFYLPKIMEQQKIGGFFSKLDRQIELEEQKLAKLEEQKKGYMQQIFSQKLRFKDEIGNNYPNWEIEKLGDLINEVNERTISNNQYELLSSTKSGLLSQEEYFKKQIGSKDSTGYKILRLNQLVLSPQNLWLGNINFNQRFDIGIVSPSYRIYNLSHHFDINFAKYLLKSPRYIYEYAQVSEQGASVVRRNLNLDLFYSIIISLPSIKEQRKIGSFLNKLDKLIEKQSHKIELLKERKKGLLQKMFV
ncbi:restriction endonuclease subunit S [Mammaliicoccus fleurettii]|nr:restriction endonuclease subunit S [Mammaliicoccus fleurettii]